MSRRFWRRFTLAKSRPGANSRLLLVLKAKQAGTAAAATITSTSEGAKQQSSFPLAEPAHRVAAPCPGLSPWCSIMVSAACWTPPALPCGEIPGLIFGMDWDANRVTSHQLTQQENREAETLCSLLPSVRSSGTLKDSSGITCHLTTLSLLPQHPTSQLAKPPWLAGRQGEPQPWGKAVPVIIPVPSRAAGH